MKILILNRHNSLAVNGLKKIILSFIDLCNDDSRKIFYYGMQQSGPLTKSIKNKNSLIHFNIKRDVSIMSDLYNIIKLIFISYKYKIDIVHAHAAKPGMIARVASIFSPIKVIYTPNNWYFEGQKGFKKLLFLSIEKFLSFIPKQTIVAVTESEKNMIFSKINKRLNVKIIPDGIDFNSLNKSSLHDNDYYNLQKLKNHKKIIGSIIRLDNQKNPLEILEYAKFLRTNNNLYFYIIGDGSLMTECKNFINEHSLSNVFLAGFKENYSSFYDLFDYTLFTSNNEGLPLIMIESIYNNTKIITKDFRGAKDFVSIDRGKILTSRSTYKRAFELEEYIDNDVHNLEIHSETFVQQFSRETMIDKYLKIYDDTI
tara:strand:- start:6867 stop:7976 length:1110 start_codon:yes stop_codon:yes gene_type:complete